MVKSRCKQVLLALIAAALCGCGKKDTPPLGAHRPANAYFQTHFQDESQFIVENILTDMAEMAYFTINKALPDSDIFLVEAVERGDSVFRAPIYDVEITLREKKSPLKFVLAVNGPIWSPEVYTNAAGLIFDAVKLSHGTPYSENDDGAMLADLTDSKATTIEAFDQSLSSELEHNFSNPVLHEKAAALLGAFAMRETSGHFFDLRPILCRMTAHLGFAKTLTGGDRFGLSGSVAEAVLYTGMGNQKVALEKINGIESKNTAIIAWQRALRLYNDFDYRPLAKAKDLTPIERIAQFNAECYSMDVNPAWAKLKPGDFDGPDFCRVANSYDNSVQTGHGLMEATLPLEMKEISEVHQAFFGTEINPTKLVKELNEMPDRCFSAGAKPKPKVLIIGWGQWAGQLQRHLCYALQQHYHFLAYKWGLTEEAAKFSEQSDASYSGLRLYPFVQRYNCTDLASYHRAVDAAATVMFTTPQLVAPEIWNQLGYKTYFAELYFPRPDPHVNEWFKHNPPPGTVYNIGPRMDHPSLVSRPDTLAIFELLHQIAPYNGTVTWQLNEGKYNGKATYQQLMEMYPGADYMVGVMALCAESVQDQPDKYEKLMNQAAEGNPVRLWEISNYFLERKDLKKAAEYSEKAYDLDPDKVRVSSRCGWLMHYSWQQGKKERAKEIADFCGEVYSSAGLCSKAEYFELAEQYDEALEWYKKNEERYNYAGPLLDFCSRYRAKTGDTRFNSVVQDHFGKIFPKGEEKVALKDFNGTPKWGTLINENNDLLAEAGLKSGDIIVALYGIRAYDLRQYTYLRDNSTVPQLDLIVWQDGQYRAIQARPPNRRFGADFRDYKAK